MSLSSLFLLLVCGKWGLQMEASAKSVSPWESQISASQGHGPESSLAASLQAGLVLLTGMEALETDF